MNIGKNIKKYRELRGITQLDVATELGLNIRTYQCYEEGSIEPHFSRLRDLSEILEVPITDLLGLPERVTIESITLQELYHKQYELDQLILSKSKVESHTLLLDTQVALTVEISELYNELANFKHWKKNRSVDMDKVREEYVDCLHFFLSLGNQLEISPGEVERAYLEKYEKNIRRQHEGY